MSSRHEATKSRRKSFRAVVFSWRPLGGRGLPGREVAGEFLYRRVRRALQLVVQLFLVAYPREHLRVAGLDKAIEVGLEVAHLGDGDGVEEPVGAGVDDRELPLDRERRRRGGLGVFSQT